MPPENICAIDHEQPHSVGQKIKGVKATASYLEWRAGEIVALHPLPEVAAAEHHAERRERPEPEPTLAHHHIKIRGSEEIGTVIGQETSVDSVHLQSTNPDEDRDEVDLQQDGIPTGQCAQLTPGPTADWGGS